MLQESIGIFRNIDSKQIQMIFIKILISVEEKIKHRVISYEILNIHEYSSKFLINICETLKNVQYSCKFSKNSDETLELSQILMRNFEEYS